MDLSIVMPCLNEAETLATCIRKALIGIEQAGVPGEIIIADNGSSDGSQDIALAEGARVVAVERKGYGNALRGGIRCCHRQMDPHGRRGRQLRFLKHRTLRRKTPRRSTTSSWAAGCLPVGAPSCPARCHGNTVGLAIPILTFIGRLFFKSPAKDFHCGLRAFTKDAYRAYDLANLRHGVRFRDGHQGHALQGLKITEVPIILHPDGRSRAPHLRSWRDGWRHLRFMLLFSPRWLFLIPGIGICLLGTVGTFPPHPRQHDLRQGRA